MSRGYFVLWEEGGRGNEGNSHVFPSTCFENSRTTSSPVVVLEKEEDPVDRNL